MPLATVILNSYNQEPYLAEAIESVLGQTVDDLELLVVDNGSTDGSSKVIDRYAGDRRVRTFLHSDNAPITRRFNQGVAEAKGEFVSFLYSDDLMLPEKLERQLEAFAGLPADYGVVYSPALGLNAVSGKSWAYGNVGASGWVFEALLRDHFAGQIDMVSPLTRRSCLERHPFFEDIFAEGEGIFFRIALTHRFHYLGTPLVVLRDHGGNAGKAVRKNAEMTMVMLDRLERHPELPERSVAAVHLFRARLLGSYAWQGARLGEEAGWVRACLAEAIRLRPRLGLSPRTVGALALGSLPGGLRQALNRAGTTLRRSPGNTVLGDGFGEAKA